MIEVYSLCLDCTLFFIVSWFQGEYILLFVVRLKQQRIFLINLFFHTCLFKILLSFYPEICDMVFVVSFRNGKMIQIITKTLEEAETPDFTVYM